MRREWEEIRAYFGAHPRVLLSVLASTGVGMYLVMVGSELFIVRWDVGVAMGALAAACLVVPTLYICGCDITRPLGRRKEK